ncbi:MAG: DNA replication/repair protein RecF [Bacteriovoracales bacterium]
MEGLKITALQVKNFRNLQEEIIRFGPSINCIVGENGNGKTNILEAIYFISTKKSFRKKTAFPQILSIDGEKPEIIISSTFLDKNFVSISLSAKVELKNLNWFINGRSSKKNLPFKVVFINPFDSYTFHQEAKARRHFFDYHIGLLNDSYRKTLARYNLAIRQRNTLLTQRPSRYLDQIAALDEQLCVYIFELTEARISFIKDIAPFLNANFQEVFSDEHTLKINLESKFIHRTPADILEILRKRLPEDEKTGHCGLGSHRDDYLVFMDGLNTFEYSSLGQQKMAYLSLLFAYIEYFRYKFNSYPVLLIDDVSGELDGLRWERLVQYLKRRNFQVFITTANENFKLELEKIEGTTRIKVVSGFMINEK